MGNRIVILGAGFAGVRCALDLSKTLGSKYDIVLINKRLEHIYRPDLYEVATAFHPKITEACMTKLSNAVAISLNKIFDHKPVRVIIDRVLGIDRRSKAIMLEQNKKISYDYLVTALGTVTNDFSIPGLLAHSYSLKTTTDAIKLGCAIDALFYNRWKENSRAPIRIVIGGGGATGVEFAAELKGYTDKLCKKYHRPTSIVSIQIIEGSDHLAAQNKIGTRVILARLKKLHVTTTLKTRITKVHAHSITTQHEGKPLELPHDLFVWSGGVMPHILIKNSFTRISAQGGLEVNDFLQSVEDQCVFGCGDNIQAIDSISGARAPWLAQCAIAQGQLVAHNIAAHINGKPLKKYKLHIKGVVIPLGKRFGILERNGKIISGRSVWWLRRLIDLSYSLSILPWGYAIKKWFAANRIFAQND